MTQSVVSKGKTVQDAINLGLNILGVTADEVNIEILQRETKGFLGIRAKEAQVKLTKLNEKISSPKSNNQEQSKEPSDSNLVKTNESLSNQEQQIEETDSSKLEGKVWVKDGKIFYHPSQTIYPIISVGKGVKLYKNNELVVNSTVVMKEDVFEIITEVEEKETIWDVSMDEQKLRVILTVEPGYEKTWTVKDIEPDHAITLYAEESIQSINHLKYEQIITKLSELNVKQGFNHNEIMKAIQSLQPGKFEIVTGVMPTEGQNGRLQIMVETEQKEGPKQLENGNVDYREMISTPSVHKGQVIAKILPPIPGRPGVTVTNEPIPPKQTYPLIVKEGKGVTTINNGTTVIATEFGRPSIIHKGNMVKVSVLPKHIHSGDVNLASGNIRFTGDIDILGNVTEGMCVEAIGEIYILGNANMATITTNGSIKIAKNVIGSTLSAGKGYMLVGEMGYILEMIKMEVDKMIASIEQLMKNPAFKMTDLSKGGLRPLIRLLIEQKFKTLPILIKKYLDVITKGENLLEKNWIDLGEMLRLYFLTLIPNDVITLMKLHQLSNNLTEQIELSQELNENPASITALYAINSTIYSSGDVSIYGQGCYNTKIHSGGELKINGILRGGEVYGRLGVQANEVGSELGVLTRISVPQNQSVLIKKAREGTEIMLGNIKHVIQKQENNIRIRLDEKGSIVINHF